METLYKPVNGKPAVTTQGASGAQDGGHWQSGPIWICGAEPGDVLQVRLFMILYARFIIHCGADNPHWRKWQLLIHSCCLATT